MSLRSFHILFIGVSALLCVWMGVWAVALHRAGDPAGRRWAALAAAGLAGLLAYLAAFIRRRRAA